MGSLTVIVSVLLLVLSMAWKGAMSQNVKNDKDLLSVLEYADHITTFSHNYRKSANMGQNAFLTDRNSDIAARAKMLLDSDLGAETNSKYDVSSTCLTHTKLFIEALVGLEPWALRMIDAMGKPHSGLLEGHLTWLGSYDECVSVEAFKNETPPVYPYTGQYCKTSFITGTGATLFSPVAAITIGMCFPSSCSEADVRGLSNTLVSLVPGINMTTMAPTYVVCQKENLEYEGKAIAVIVVCSIFLTVMALATAYDLIVVFWLSKDASMENGYLPIDSKYGSANNSLGRNGHMTSDTTPLLRSSGTHASQNGTSSYHQSDIRKVNPAKKSTYQHGFAGKLLLSFSVYTNASKILGTSQPAGTLTAVNGIRFISMTWVILGHTYAFGLQNVENVAVFLPAMLKRFTFQAIDNATVAVDTFFVLSGLLVAYLSLKEMKKRGGMFKFNWGMYYFHRFWRLTPPYMLWLMVYVVTIKYWYEGPLWSQTGIEVDECRDTWWQNILYINNFYPAGKQCMAWAWYLANDMQFYIISPLMLIPLYYSPLWGTISCFALILVNFISAGVISSDNNLLANSLLSTTNGGDFFDKLYVKPWARIGPYAVGFFTGYLLYITDCKVKMNKVVNALGWLIATAMALLTLYGLYSSDGVPSLGISASALYNATSRTAWGIAIAWVVFACATGYGGPVNTLLSWRAIIPLSRLTYCAYLVHPVVMYTYHMSRHTFMYWQDIQIIYLFLAHACLSYAVAFVVSLAFESPMMGLEKVLLGRGKNS